MDDQLPNINQNTDFGAGPRVGGVETRRLKDTAAISHAVRMRERLFSGRLAMYNERLRRIDSTTAPDFIEKLLQLGEEPNATIRTSEGTSASLPALHQAIEKNNTPCLKVLLRYGADPSTTFRNTSPLQYAVQFRNMEADSSRGGSERGRGSRRRCYPRTR